MIYDIFLILYLLGCLVGLCFVFRKAGMAWWKALIPVYNIVLWIKLANKKWMWYLYFLIPAVNIFVFLLMVVETAKCFHRYGYGEQTFAVIFPWIYLPLVGLNKWEYHDPRTEEPHKVSEARDWLDALTFALVAAVIIRGMVLEFYNIPSSSMEKSLMTGDYLLVSKSAYGPRMAMTPLSFPLVHNTLPFTDGQCESYLKWIRLPYHRYLGFGKVKRYDAVVFNYPDGDTMCTAWKSNCSYYDLVRDMGREAVWDAKMLPVQGRMVENHVRVRPVDKRENFIKRCIGLPGEELQIINQTVYINGKPLQPPANSQQTYAVRFKAGYNTRKILTDVGVSHEDYSNALNRMMYEGGDAYQLPLSGPMVAALTARPEVMEVAPVVYSQEDEEVRDIFPYDDHYSWTVDNFGPIHIPAKGETLRLTAETLPLYRRLIEVYEGNQLEERDGQILINGVATDHYTCRMDYYWMMGDNRHNSADSRFWGFVPEDHIAGKGSMVIFSIDKDSGRIRWNRIFRRTSTL